MKNSAARRQRPRRKALSRRATSRLHYLSVCAAFRNESLYLSEWIEYHRHIGVEHFYLYNNASTDDVASVLRRYCSDTISLVRWEQPGQQIACYNHCISHRARSTFWLAFIDLDEFLAASNGGSVAEELQSFESCAGLGLNWQTFGSGGQTFFRPEPVLRRFTRRAPSDWEMNRHVKIVGRGEHLARAVHCHVMEFHGGRRCVTAAGEELSGPHSARPNHAKLAVYHYPVKSFEEFCWKLARGRGATAHGKRWHSYFRLNDQNEVIDQSMLEPSSQIADRIECPLPKHRESVPRVFFMHAMARALKRMGVLKRRFQSVFKLKSARLG